METTYATTTRSIDLNVHLLASMNSISVFASSPKEQPRVISGLRANRSGDNELTVVATNRYVLAKAVYQNVTFNNWADSELWIDQETLKQATAMAKGFNLPDVSIGYDTDDEMTFISVADSRLNYRQDTNAFPRVEKLFSEYAEEPVGIPVVSINPKWLSMLTKFVIPESRQQKDMPWSFSFFGTTESGKPKPVQADLKSTTWAISVLIQPNVVTR
jgi:hypothetical protein